MEYVLNEISLDEQFEDVDEFLDSLSKVTLPVLKKLNEKEISLLKSNNIYSCKITGSNTFHEILQSRNYPEITKLKGLLFKLFLDDPYWDYDSKCNEESIYICEYTEDVNNYCIAEALERNTSIVSFEHEKFKCNDVELMKDEELKKVINIYDKDSILMSLLECKHINYSEYICEKYNNVMTFCIINNKNYFEEFIAEKSLSYNDVNNIIIDIEELINRYNKGLDFMRFSETIENYHAFRTTLDCRREIRIFYIMEGRNFIFLNCLLKKQQATPENAKQKARNLIKEYKSK